MHEWNCELVEVHYEIVIFTKSLNHMRAISFVFIAISLIASNTSLHGQKPNISNSSQKQNDKVCLEFFYVKPVGALHHEYIQSEQKIFMPIHQAAINAGKMIGFSVFWVETSSEYVRDYDFVVVKAYKTIEDIDAIIPDHFYKFLDTIVGFDSIMQASFKTRETPRREIWTVDKSYAKNLLGNFDAAKLLMNFSTRPADDSAMFTSLVKDSVIKHWESYSLLMPQSEKYPYQHLSICPFDRYKSLPLLVEKTKGPSSKNRVKQEMWAKWVGTPVNPAQ